MRITEAHDYDLVGALEPEMFPILPPPDEMPDLQEGSRRRR